MPAMVMNAPPNGSSGVDTSKSGARHSNSILQKSIPSRRVIRRGSKGSITGFGSSSHDSSQNDADVSLTLPPSPSNLSGEKDASKSNHQPQHSDSTPTPPPPAKPCHSAKMALVCVQNASYMGARTQLNLCPPGKTRDTLLNSLQSRRRKKNRLTILPAPGPIRRTLSFQRQSSIGTVGSRAEEISGFEKVLGESGVAEYGHEEDKFLNNPELRAGDLNSDGEEIQEDPSSGDNDELEFKFDDEDAHGSGDDSDRKDSEPLYLGGVDAGSDIRGSANSGKIAFNFRKVKWFDSVTATDRATARQYLKKEISSMKKRDVKALTTHLKKLQRREKRRIEIEKGKRTRSGSTPERFLFDEDDDEASHQLSGIGKLPSPMTPSLSAALVLESLSLKSLESVEGMAKCYEGIVAAGSALLDSKIDEPSNEKKRHSKEEIMNALAPLLITSLEQASGDTILALAKLRKSCGTKRYQRRFVQRIAPCLIRPPNAAMWCLRHQQDMESILAATELILDKSSEVFHKEWYERGRTILADSKRAEKIKVAAMQLKSLSVYQPSDRLMNGLSSSKASHLHRRSRSSSFFSKVPDHSGSGTEVMAEWEILAVDREIRNSIHNLFAKDWQRVVVSNAPARDGEPQSKKLRGISAGKTKSLSIDVDTSSNEQGQYVNSPPRLSHHNRISPSNNAVPFAISNGSRGTLSIPPETSPVHSKHHKSDNQKSDPYDPTSPPLTPRNNEYDVPNTPPRNSPRSPPHASSYQLSPRNPLSPQKYMDSSVDNTKSPAPLSPVNAYRRQHDSSHQRLTSNTAGSSPSAQSKYLRTLTSSAAERKRTVAACRALRAQIQKFEEAYTRSYGRHPKGAERAPLASTYAQYREWKRAIRADAASRIQALARGARVRSYLVQNPSFKEIVRRKAGRPIKVSHPIISQNNGSNSNVKEPTKIQPQPIAPVRRDDGSVEIVMGPVSAWNQHSASDMSHDSSNFSSSQFTKSSGSGSLANAFKLEIAHLSLAELQTQKRELKQELKKYDVSFYNKHGRMPIKAEKEPIRHLYEQYNQLKNRITAIERDPSLIKKSILGPRRPIVSIPNSPDKSLMSNSPSNDSPSSAISAQTHARSDPFSSRQTSPSGPALTLDLESLKIEKQSLHSMLRSYEKEFFKNCGRQVSSYADIRPVASQYRRYKEIKKSILALQSTGKK